MKRYFLLSLIFLSVFFCRTAVADFYKWVDEKGQTRITDYPPPEDKKAKDVVIHKSESENVKAVTGEADAATNKDVKKADVVIYTKNDCKDCEKAIEFLKSKNVDFTEYNVDNDKDAAMRRQEMENGDDVPFAIINRNQVHGFQESVYERVLNMEP